MTRPRAGDLDRTIVIQRATETISDSGGVTATYAPIATMRAKLAEITTSDILRNAGGLTDAIMIFSTRWLDGITTADRVSYAGASLEIKSIREIGRRQGLEITCEALK